MKHLWFMAAVVCSVAACADDDKVCAGVGLVRYPPADTTIAVGTSFLLRYEEGETCTPGLITDADYRVVARPWTTLDTLVVQLDSLTQRVTGRRIGDATISAVPYGMVVRVHVR